LRPGKPILLWIIVIGYAIWAVLGISQVTNLLSLEMPGKRYPVLLSNEVAYFLYLFGFLGGRISSAGLAIAGFLQSRWTLVFASGWLVSILCTFLATLEGISFGRSLPESMIGLYVAYWASVILLGTLVVTYLVRLRRREILA